MSISQIHPAKKLSPGNAGYVGGFNVTLPLPRLAAGVGIPLTRSQELAELGLSSVHVQIAWILELSGQIDRTAKFVGFSGA